MRCPDADRIRGIVVFDAVVVLILVVASVVSLVVRHIAEDAAVVRVDVERLKQSLFPEERTFASVGLGEGSNVGSDDRVVALLIKRVELFVSIAGEDLFEPTGVRRRGLFGSGRKLRGREAEGERVACGT